MEDDINRIINGYIQARDAANYAEALVVDMYQNGDTDDYSMIWTNAYQGAYPPQE